MLSEDNVSTSFLSSVSGGSTFSLQLPAGHGFAVDDAATVTLVTSSYFNSVATGSVMMSSVVSELESLYLEKVDEEDENLVESVAGTWREPDAFYESVTTGNVVCLLRVKFRYFCACLL